MLLAMKWTVILWERGERQIVEDFVGKGILLEEEGDFVGVEDLCCGGEGFDRCWWRFLLGRGGF